MRKYLFIIICLLFSFPFQGEGRERGSRQTVVLAVDIHCQGCCDKIMKNIAFEKGVKDLVCDLDTKTVTVTYDASKTDIPTLLKAFEKIHKPATVKEIVSKNPKDPKDSKLSKDRPSADAESGASTPY